MKLGVETERVLLRMGWLHCAGCDKGLAQVPMKTYDCETWLCDGCAFGDASMAPVTRAMARDRQRAHRVPRRQQYVPWRNTR